MGFKITMMQSFRTRNLLDSFVLLGEGRDMVEVSQLVSWCLMIFEWRCQDHGYTLVHHSHYRHYPLLIDWVRLHFLHQSFGRSIASVRDISGESCEACGSGMFGCSPCSDSDVGWFLHIFADVNLVLESIDRGHSFPVRNRNRIFLLKSRWLQLCQYIQYGWIWCLSEDGESGKIVILRYFNWKMMINNLVFR